MYINAKIAMFRRNRGNGEKCHLFNELLLSHGRMGRGFGLHLRKVWNKDIKRDVRRSFSKLWHPLVFSSDCPTISAPTESQSRTIGINKRCSKGVKASLTHSSQPVGVRSSKVLHHFNQPLLEKYLIKRKSLLVTYRNSRREKLSAMLAFQVVFHEGGV